MATQTEKLGLLKPTYDEPADIAVINENMDKIDTGFAQNETAINKNASDISALDTRVTENTTNIGLKASVEALSNTNSRVTQLETDYSVLDDKITALEGTTKFIGADVLDNRPTTAEDGNIYVATDDGKEYIWVNDEWVELGDTTAERKAIQSIIDGDDNYIPAKATHADNAENASGYVEGGAIDEALKSKTNLGTPSVNTSSAYVKNVPDTSAPYAEISKVGGMSYKDGNTLRDAKVTEVKSVGKNLHNPNTDTLGYYKDPTYGTQPSLSAFYTDYTRVKPSTKYTYSSTISYIYFYDANKQLISSTLDKAQVTTPSNCYYMVWSGFTANPENWQVCEGNEAPTDLTYTEHTLAIPESVQNLDSYGCGINSSLYNYIDFENKKFYKRVIKLTFTSEYNWIFQEKETRNSIVTYVPKSSNIRLGICNLFDYSYTSDSSFDHCYVETNDTLVIETTMTLEEFKALLVNNPLEIVYPVAETTEDISNFITSDNLISVESGGTLTFENEYGYDVPSEVTFYLGNNEVIGANEFVGDLKGIATRAENAKTAETATKATYLSKGEWHRIDSSAFNSIQYILDLDSWYLIEACKTVDETFCSSFVLHTPLELSTVTPTFAYSSASRGVKSGTTEDYTYVSVDHMPNYSANSYTFSYSGSCDYLRIRKIM